MSKVAVVYGNNRYENVLNSLSLLKKEISQTIKNKKRIVIKVNMVRTSIPLAATHVDAVRAVLDFLKQFTRQKIEIVEGSYEPPTSRGFKDFGYYEALKDYNVEFIDLNHDKFVEVKIEDTQEPKYFTTLKFKVAKTIYDSDFRIAVGPPKTHDTVGVTLGLKNLVAGSIVVDKDADGHYWRGEIHQYGAEGLHRILYQLAKIIPPHLNVIDGFLGMEGAGPSHGEPVEMNLAISGLDFLAVDSMATYLMGFNPKKVKYLNYCSKDKLGTQNFHKMKIVGLGNFRDYRKHFKPHKACKYII